MSERTSDDISRRVNKIEGDVSDIQQTVGGVKTEVAVVNSKIDGQDKHLQEIKNNMKLQTDILNRLLTLTDRHDNFEKEFKCLKEDYGRHKTEIIKLVGTMRGLVLAGAVFVSMIIGLGLYIYSDKMVVLQGHESRIHSLEVN